MLAAPRSGARTRENRTRYVVLGMLTAGPKTGYSLRQGIKGSVGHFWRESYGQLYPTLQRLTAEGLVQARPARGGPGRGATAYHLTARGRTELARWVALPPVLEPERNELLLKVFFAGAVPPEVTARNLELVAERLRAELAALQAIAARWDAEAGGQPDAPYWRLTLDFGLVFMRTALGWIDHAQAVVRTQRPRARGVRQVGSTAPGARPRPAAGPGGSP
jgi:PadR family transcriptional regulator, regulatory protein AphA